MKPHQEVDRVEGCPIGRDPRRMSAAELIALGKPRISRGDAIRANCLDCCAGNAAEIRRCGHIGCPLWPFRMGTDPYRAPMSEERKRAMAIRLRDTKARAAAQ